MVVDISGWGTGSGTLWQPHLPVNSVKGAIGLPRFTWKMAVESVYVCMCDNLSIELKTN